LFLLALIRDALSIISFAGLKPSGQQIIICISKRAPANIRELDTLLGSPI